MDIKKVNTTIAKIFKPIFEVWNLINFHLYGFRNLVIYSATRIKVIN